MYPHADKSPARNQISAAEADGVTAQTAWDSPKSALDGPPRFVSIALLIPTEARIRAAGRTTGRICLVRIYHPGAPRALVASLKRKCFAEITIPRTTHANTRAAIDRYCEGDCPGCRGDDTQRAKTPGDLTSVFRFGGTKMKPLVMTRASGVMISRLAHNSIFFC